MYIAYSPYQYSLSDNPTWTFFAYLDIVYLTKIELDQFRTIFQSEFSEMEFGFKQGIVLILGLAIALPRFSKLLFGTGGSLTTDLTKEITDNCADNLFSISGKELNLLMRVFLLSWKVITNSVCKICESNSSKLLLD